MLRMSISELTTYRWTLERDVERYADEGFAALGVWRQKLSDHGEQDGIDLIRHSSLSASSLSWAGGFTGSDGRSHRETVRDAREAIRLTDQLKASCLITYTGSRGGHTSNHARRLVCQAFASLLPLAEELKVTLALEPMHERCADEWTFLTDVDQTLELLRDLASPQVKMVFDVYHLAHDPRNIDRLPELAPHIGLVQLGDAVGQPEWEQKRCCLGDGELPLERIVHSLLQNGYDGYWEVELMGEDVEWMDCGELLRRTRNWMSELAPVS